MSSSFHIKKTAEHLSCPVCRQLFKNPKFLPCYHSYCEGCLEKIMERSKITCPECRQEAIVPTGGVKNFQSNFFVNRMMDELIFNCKEDSGEVQCDSCDEADPVVSYCPDCNYFLCQVCNNYHKCDKLSRGHGTVPLNNLKSDHENIPRVKMLRCREHDNEMIFYCETCEELVCSSCTMKYHSGHEHDTIKRMANEFKRTIKENTSVIDMMITAYTDAHKSIKTVKEQVKRQGKDVSKRIDAYYDGLFERLMEQRQQLIQEVHGAIDTKEKALTIQLDEVGCILAQLTHIKEANESAKGSINHQEILLAKKQIDEGMKQLADDHKKLNTHMQPVEVDTVQFFPNHDKLSFPQFGEVFLHVDPLHSTVLDFPQYMFKGVKVDFRISARYSNGHHYPRGGNRVTVALQYSKGEITTTTVRDCNDGNYEVSFVPQEVGNLKLFASIDGQPIKDSPYHILVGRNYPSIKQPTNIVNYHGRMGKPWGIAFGPKNGVWAVVDQSNHCVYVFQHEDYFLWKFGNKGPNVGQLNNPCGITFDVSNFLYVADFNNRRVQKVDINGNYVFHYGEGASGERTLDSPVGVVTHDNKVYVADSTLNCIVKFTNNGGFCQTIGKGLLCNPNGVIITKQNHLLVADCDHGCIFSFTLDGHCIGKFGENKLSGPRSLTVDEDGFVFITDTGNHRVIVYSKDGCCIHQFGSKGKTNFQLLNPRGVAVSSNGNIYICDSLNSCIKIYTCL